MRFSKIICFFGAVFLCTQMHAYATPNVGKVSNEVSKQNTTQLAQTNLSKLSVKPKRPTGFEVFAPQTQSSNASIDFEVWDLALNDVVLRMGQSVRIRERRPQSAIGTRLVKGHSSPYRLEGSRVMFYYLSEGFTNELTAYREDLVSIANNNNLQSLSRKEQLAFWYNLHNVLLIETISKHYPNKRPSEIRIGTDKQPLHEAKLITINGVPLSLKNIREDIVYQNWPNPDVIYGFFWGDIGGPGLMNYAITSSNVDYVIKQQAFEFVNSLRGFHTTNSSRNVSKIYENARPYFFQNWPHDLDKHLKKHATDDVMEEINQNKPYKIARYDRTIADLMGGDNPTSFFNSSVNGHHSSGNVPPQIQRLAAEIRVKTRRMQKRGMLTGLSQVIITDIDTAEPDTEKKP